MTDNRPTLPDALFVDPGWLESRVGDERLAVVDLRDGDDYVAGHVPGAVHLDLGDLGRTHGACDNVVLPPAEFELLISSLGISNQDVVVAYDDHWGLPAARLAWSLHYYGHSAVGVLNGGWDLWQQEGHPVTAGESAGRSGVFEARVRADVYADSAWISGASAREDLVLLDTRSEAEFDAGHLPGATWWDWFNAVPDGSWACSRDPRVLRSELEALGVRRSDEIVTYCRSGMRAAHTYVVLRNAGFGRVRLFDGSWQEWSTKMGDG